MFLDSCLVVMVMTKCPRSQIANSPSPLHNDVHISQRETEV